MQVSASRCRMRIQSPRTCVYLAATKSSLLSCRVFGEKTSFSAPTGVPRTLFVWSLFKARQEDAVRERRKCGRFAPASFTVLSPYQAKGLRLYWKAEYC